jgi:MFS family permease
MAVYGLAGVPGMILGGLLGDVMYRRRRSGRLMVAAFAMLLACPALYLALTQPQGQWAVFAFLFGFGCMMLYTYYATVYSAIQDVIEPSLRATAMALYFCAMYAFGGAAGDPTIGLLSDHYAHSAAIAQGIPLDGLQGVELQKVLEPFRAEGLHKAMFALPLVSLLLAATLFAAARTIPKDMEKLQDWMREQTDSEPVAPTREKVAT